MTIARASSLCPWCERPRWRCHHDGYAHVWRWACLGWTCQFPSTVHDQDPHHPLRMTLSLTCSPKTVACLDCTSLRLLLLKSSGLCYQLSQSTAVASHCGGLITWVDNTEPGKRIFRQPSKKSLTAVSLR